MIMIYKQGVSTFTECNEFRIPTIGEWFLKENRPIYRTAYYYEGEMNSSIQNKEAKELNSKRYLILKII